MKCPYCLADMDAAALVCTHCSHDLYFLRPLLEQLAALERRLVSAEERIAQVTLAVTHRGRRLLDVRFHWTYAAFTAAAAVIGTAAYYWSCSSTAPAAAWLFWACVLVPVVAGLVLGLWWPGRHFSGYLLLGSMLGAVNLAGLAWVDQGPVGGWVATAWVAGAVLMFTAGGEVGDMLESLRAGQPFRSRLAGNLAARLVPAAAFGGGDRSVQVEQFAKVLTAAAPILTILAGLLNALLTKKP